MFLVSLSLSKERVVKIFITTSESIFHRRFDDEKITWEIPSVFVIVLSGGGGSLFEEARQIWWLERGRWISSWEDASKVDGNLSSGLEIITNVLLSNDSFIPIKYRPIRINTKFFWLRVTSSYFEFTGSSPWKRVGSR